MQAKLADSTLLQDFVNDDRLMHIPGTENLTIRFPADLPLPPGPLGVPTTGALPEVPVPKSKPRKPKKDAGAPEPTPHVPELSKTSVMTELQKRINDISALTLQLNLLEFGVIEWGYYKCVACCLHVMCGVACPAYLGLAQDPDGPGGLWQGFQDYAG